VNNDAKKAVLRMIPYGIYVLTADDGKGNIAAATVNWVTQSAFAPPLVVVGVKADSGTYETVKAARVFALNMLGKDQKGLAFTFFRPVDVTDGKLSGQTYRKGDSGAPILADAPGAVECRVTEIIAQGDHHISGRRGDRGPSQPRALGAARRRDLGNEGPRGQRLLRRVSVSRKSGHRFLRKGHAQRTDRSRSA
jgi:flavin reductase (DIM6/NTAB) family NADH-FMN oxidoreductase RutF